ncbi:hypothetical protein D3M95_08960 [Corynebacterium falsenii]|uniref:Uncharacterized protein n=1 Tax=Corynebacterium falsenii TaxID=108486 RepID=A0A418Q5Q2_9CORY|nr:hypothetical protein D3M95_08960 [Corynebacterium falsenii]
MLLNAPGQASGVVVELIQDAMANHGGQGSVGVGVWVQRRRMTHAASSKQRGKQAALTRRQVGHGAGDLRGGDGAGGGIDEPPELGGGGLEELWELGRYFELADGVR